MATPALLEVDELSVQYRRRRVTVNAVQDVSFEIGAGETVGLVGESGSGKSTIANAILGLAPIQAGSVYFAGGDVTHLEFKQRRELYRHVQVVFQDPYGSLNPSRTIARTLAEPLESYGERNRDMIRARVRDMLARVHLSPETSARYPRQLSGGQRQRVAIARALMLSPQLVICDEAVSALDLSVQAQILNLLRELQLASGLSYLFISHDLDVVRHMCDRVIVLYRGRVMESGPVNQVSTHAAHPYTQALHEASPVPNPALQRERQAVGTSDDSVTRGGAAITVVGGCPFAPRCAYAELRCWESRPALRVLDGGGMVACHRYPKWRDERASTPAFHHNGLKVAPANGQVSQCHPEA